MARVHMSVLAQHSVSSVLAQQRVWSFQLIVIIIAISVNIGSSHIVTKLLVTFNSIILCACTLV